MPKIQREVAELRAKFAEIPHFSRKIHWLRPSVPIKGRFVDSQVLKIRKLPKLSTILEGYQKL